MVRNAGKPSAVRQALAGRLKVVHNRDVTRCCCGGRSHRSGLRCSLLPGTSCRRLEAPSRIFSRGFSGGGIFGRGGLMSSRNGSSPLPVSRILQPRIVRVPVQPLRPGGPPGLRPPPSPDRLGPGGAGRRHRGELQGPVPRHPDHPHRQTGDAAQPRPGREFLPERRGVPLARSSHQVSSRGGARVRGYKARAGSGRAGRCSTSSTRSKRNAVDARSRAAAAGGW